MTLLLKTSYMKHEIAQLILECEQELDAIVTYAKRSKETYLYLESALNELAHHFFQSTEEFKIADLKRQECFDHQIFDRLSAINLVMQGGSKQFTCLEQRMDGIGVVNIASERADIDEMKREIQLGVAKKIHTLLVDIHQGDQKSEDGENSYHISRKHEHKKVKECELDRKASSSSAYLKDVPQESQLALSMHPQFSSFVHAKASKEHTVMQACLSNPHLFYFAQDSFKEDAAFVQRLIKAVKEQSPAILHHASLAVKDDFHVAWLAIHKSAESYFELTLRLQTNRDILIYLAKNHPEMVSQFPLSVLQDAHMMALSMVST